MNIQSNIITIDSLLDRVYGFLDPAETQLLYDLASQVPTHGTIVEIGSYQGKSTIAMAMGAFRPDAIVYAIDHHSDMVSVDTRYGMMDNAFYMENIVNYKLGNVIKTINLPSYDVVKIWTLPIDLIFIDGAHDYDSVKHDFEQWSPFVRGWLCFHDTSGHYPEVSQLMDEIIAAGEWKRVQLVDATSVFERVK